MTSSTTFDPAAGWARSSNVGLRPEPFGALAYHFDTRRLVFLKSRKLVDLVDGLADHASAFQAIDAIIEPADERSRGVHVKALASLAEAGVIEPTSPERPEPAEQPVPSERPAQTAAVTVRPATHLAPQPSITFVG